MRSGPFVLGIALTLALATFALVLSTCGSGKRAMNPPSIGSDNQPQHRVAPPFQPVTDASLNDTLTELDALETPAGVDPALFTQLKDALRDALIHPVESRLSSRDYVGGAGVSPANIENHGRDARATSGAPYRIASTPPTGDANKVTDLTITDNGDGTYTLSWHYRNLGDYDQDGTVGISDILPLAEHFGEEVPGDDDNSLQAVIDGSGNGVVDIADVTPLAMNLGVGCAGYSIRGASSYPNSLDETSEIGTVEFANAAGEGRKYFNEPLPESEFQFFAVAPYDSTGDPGELSNVEEIPRQPPVAELSAEPASGDAPLEVDFDASSSSDPDGTIVRYEWDWEGDGIYDHDSGDVPTAEHTYELAGTYDPTVRVTDDDDATDTASTTVTVNEPSVLEWHTMTVDSARYVGDHTSLAIVNGNPAISYYGGTNWDLMWNLKYVRASDVTGSSWGTPVTVDSAGVVGWYTSLAIVNGNPAISYYDNSYGDLKYVRASDANGSSWGTPVTIDSVGRVGRYTSLAVVNGNPAISYWDQTNEDLKYVRASDANGSSWGTPVTVDSAGEVGEWASLAIVNGNPAISYYDDTNDDLKYVRASDASGGSWGTPVTVDSAGYVGRFTSLAIVNGNPAISYYTSTGDDLKYVRAIDADGNSWGAPVTVDNAGDVGVCTSLKVVNGNPAISYHDDTNDDLKYVRASDASGGSWGTPITVDSAGDVGEWTSLAIVNGNPAISYFDSTSDDLKYASATKLKL